VPSYLKKKPIRFRRNGKEANSVGSLRDEAPGVLLGKKKRSPPFLNKKKGLGKNKGGRDRRARSNFPLLSSIAQQKDWKKEVAHRGGRAFALKRLNGADCFGRMIQPRELQGPSPRGKRGGRKILADLTSALNIPNECRGDGRERETATSSRTPLDLPCNRRRRGLNGKSRLSSGKGTRGNW